MSQELKNEDMKALILESGDELQKLLKINDELQKLLKINDDAIEQTKHIRRLHRLNKLKLDILNSWET